MQRQVDWSDTILDALRYPNLFFMNLQLSGTKDRNHFTLNRKKNWIIPETPVYATASHDTGAAVAAIPCDQETYGSCEWAFLSSGTWSIIGVETPEPILTEQVMKENYSNEGGVEGTIRLLKNTTGFWVLRGMYENLEKRKS